MITIFVISYFILANTIHFFIYIFAIFRIRKYKNNTLHENEIPISVLMPAYNEEKNIISSVKSMLNLDYKDYEVIVCNDGSKDQTLYKLISAFELNESELDIDYHLKHQQINAIYKSDSFPNLTVIDKNNGGKADALNCAINCSNHSLICCTDADCLIDKDALQKTAKHFIENEKTIAVGGSVFALFLKEDRRNESWNYLGCIQCIEYFRAFLVGRMAWDLLDANTIISGAFGLFCKQTVINCGGYKTDTIGEDMELCVRMQLYCTRNDINFKVNMALDAVCWTELPPNISTLGKQRKRWIQGLIETIWFNRKLSISKNDLKLLLPMIYHILFELLVAPIELISYFLIGINIYDGDIYHAYSIFFVTLCAGFLINTFAMFYDKIFYSKLKTFQQHFNAFLGCFLEVFGYRQVHIYWRLAGIYNWLNGNKKWGAMERKGF